MTKYRIDIGKEITLAQEEVETSLERAARFAVLGDQFARLPIDIPLPQASSLIHLGDLERNEPSVRQHFSALSTAMAVNLMITAFEYYLFNLLFLRRLAEKARTSPVLSGEDMGRLRRDVLGEGRGRPAVILSKIIETQTDRVKHGSFWLDGIYRVRVCLTHRDGHVDLLDVDEDGTLKVIWRTIELQAGSESITTLPYTFSANTDISLKISEQMRQWALEDHITLSPKDCVDIGTSLIFLAGWILSDFHNEIAALMEPE